MQNFNEPKTQPSAITNDEKTAWDKPALREFGVASTTQNAGIINLDLDHALDIS